MRSFALDLRRNQTDSHQRGWLRADIPQIAKLMSKLSAEYDSELEFTPPTARCLRWLNRSFFDAWHYFHVVRVAEEIVAIAGLARSRVPGIDGHLHSVYVEPEFRGYGFGRVVTQGVIDYARSLHMSSLEMPLTLNPVARRLYSSMGFEVFDYEGEAHMALDLLR